MEGSKTLLGQPAGLIKLKRPKIKGFGGGINGPKGLLDFGLFDGPLFSSSNPHSENVEKKGQFLVFEGFLITSQFSSTLGFGGKKIFFTDYFSNEVPKSDTYPKIHGDYYKKKN